jgi:hypothetical protein
VQVRRDEFVGKVSLKLIDIIMPATIDPAETDFTITVISEHIKTFRML